MRVFLAGASGVIGVRLVPLLIGAGHEVAAMTRSPGKADALRALGAVPAVCDVFDSSALTAAMTAFRAEAVIDELTDLPDERARLAEFAVRNNRIRQEGTRNLLAAAKATDATRILSQSVAWELHGEGGAAVAEHERLILEVGGVVIRYGRLYGPGTYSESETPPPPRLHVDRAAAITLSALDAGPGVIVALDEQL